MPNRPAPKINGDLLLDTPGGGHIHLVSDGRLMTVNCSDERALKDALDALRSVIPDRWSVFKLLWARNPLRTAILMNKKSEQLLAWNPGEYPKISSVWPFLRAFFLN